MRAAPGSYEAIEQLDALLREVRALVRHANRLDDFFDLADDRTAARLAAALRSCAHELTEHLSSVQREQRRYARQTNPTWVSPPPDLAEG